MFVNMSNFVEELLKEREEERKKWMKEGVKVMKEKKELKKELVTAVERDAEMQKILDTQSRHDQAIAALRTECEKWISKVAQAMRAKLESIVREESADVEAAFAQLRAFKTRFESELDDVKAVSESPLGESLNRLADKKATLHKLISEADQIVATVATNPSIVNLQEGLPSVSVDTYEVLRPWLGGLSREDGGIEGKN